MDQISKSQPIYDRVKKMIMRLPIDVPDPQG